jgi:hypothetical protein
MLAKKSYRACLESFQDDNIWAANEVGIKLKCRVVNALAMEDESAEIARYCRGETGDEGTVRRNQVLTMWEVIAQIREHPGRSGTLVGSTQSGKTGTINNCISMVAPILYSITGEKHFVVPIMPNRKGIVSQSEHELVIYNALYSLVQFSVKGDFISSRSYNRILSESSPAGSSWKEALTLQGFSPRTSRKKSIDEIKRKFGLADSHGMKIIVISDEFHWGSDKNGVQAKYVDPVLKVFNDGHIFLGVSATPYISHDIDTMFRVNHRLGEGYCGFNFCKGEVLDPDAEEVRAPKIVSFSEFASETGIPLDDVDRGAYYKYDQYVRYCKRRKKIEPEMECLDYADYKVMVEQTVAAAVNHRLKGKRVGMCLRFINNVERTDRFYEKLKPYLDGSIEVVKYYRAENIDCSIKEKLKRIDPTKSVLILVCSCARMADSFPSSIRHYVEFVNKSTTDTACVQGLLGRSTGYGKSESVFMAPDKEIELIRRWIRSKGQLMRSDSRVVGITEDSGANCRTTFKVSVRNNDARIVSKLRLLGDSISHLFHPRAERLKCYPIWKIFDSEFLGYLESLSPVKLLRPGGVDYGGLKYALRGDNEGEGMGKIGIRKLDMYGKEQSDRSRPGGKERDSDHVVQVHVSVPGQHVGGVGRGKYKVVSVNLRLAEVYSPLHAGAEHLPSGKNMMDNVLDEDQKRVRDSAYKGRAK